MAAAKTPGTTFKINSRANRSHGGYARQFRVVPDSHNVRHIVDVETGKLIETFFIGWSGEWQIRDAASGHVRTWDSQGNPTYLLNDDGSDVYPDSPVVEEPIEGRNWVIDGDNLYVYRNAREMENGGNCVCLPICNEAGEFTPTNTREILGQSELLYSLAVSFLEKQNSLLMGPTGVGKTMLYRWLAETLNWNLVVLECSRGTESSHIVGEYLPDNDGQFSWVSGACEVAVDLSNTHPTILLFEEINRIGNIAELARIYPLLDDSKELHIKEKGMDSSGRYTMKTPGHLYIGATANPSDDPRADYLGVHPLDPALMSRFKMQPTVDYPKPQHEIEALMAAVNSLVEENASRIVSAANAIRRSEAVRWPVSFREMQAWAEMIPHFGYNDAAIYSVVNKAPRAYREDIQNLLYLMAA